MRKYTWPCLDCTRAERGVAKHDIHLPIPQVVVLDSIDII